MRNLALAMLAIGMLSAIESAQAQTYDSNFPVCLRSYGRLGNYTDCSYTSLPQCNATASGRSAQCLTNPFFAHGMADRPGSRGRRAPVY